LKEKEGRLKVKQQTLHTFEFLLSEEEEEKLLSYLTKNEPLLKGHLILLQGEIEKFPQVEEFLKERDFCFFQKEGCNLMERKRDVHQLPNISVEEALQVAEEDNDIKITEKREREIVEKPIRSGTYIETEKDLTVLSQMNSGSEIELSGNLEIFGTVNGRIICNGVYMLLRDIGENGSVIFNGIILDKDKFKSKKAKIVRLSKDMRLVVEEL
jgi:septum site-determining protein MinC